MNLALKIVPPVQLVISASLMFYLADSFPQLHFTFSYVIPLMLLLIALACIVGSLALYGFHKHKTTIHPHTPEKTSTVVDTGVYAYSRNPMYFALILIQLALALYLGNIACFAVVPLFILYITRYQIKPEEEILTKRFPVAYQAYCKKVRRWL